MKPLKGQPAHRLLMALAMFPKPALKEAVAQVALSGTAPIDGFARLHQLSLKLQEGRYNMLPLTREYALAELRSNSEFEQEARERWLNWHLRFSEQYGSKDWREWHEYTHLDCEWDNVQTAIKWCIEQGRYEDFSRFWQYVRGYTHLYGYWSERLIWMDWWLQVAEQRLHYKTVAQALRDRAWTLTLMGKPEQLAEAEVLFSQTWELGDKADLRFQLELAIEQAILFIHQQKFETAHSWLKQSRDFLKQVHLEKPEQLRQLIRINYYEAEVWCRRGNYEQAKTLYHQVLEESQIVQWQQVEIYTLNWLADIALGQRNLNEAECLLNRSLPIAQKNQDRRSIAFHKRSWAHLVKLRGNLAQSRHQTIEAQECFEDLGMHAEAQEMRSWLNFKNEL